jgi:hypothetical protein
MPCRKPPWLPEWEVGVDPGLDATVIRVSKSCSCCVKTSVTRVFASSICSLISARLDIMTCSPVDPERPRCPGDAERRTSAQTRTDWQMAERVALERPPRFMRNSIRSRAFWGGLVLITYLALTPHELSKIILFRFNDRITLRPGIVRKKRVLGRTPARARFVLKAQETRSLRWYRTPTVKDHSRKEMR